MWRGRRQIRQTIPMVETSDKNETVFSLAKKDDTEAAAQSGRCIKSQAGQ